MELATKSAEETHAARHTREADCYLCDARPDYFCGTLYADGCSNICLDRWFDLCPKHTNMIFELFCVEKAEEA